MKNYKNIAGIRFGKLTAIEYCGTNEHRAAMWKCQCDCGNTVIKSGARLRNGKARSCGCLQKETAATQMIRFNNSEKRVTDGHKTHGESDTRLYHIWLGMRRRCHDCKNDNYQRYGGRGITVCNEWDKDYGAFAKWSKANGYEDALELDRIDNDGNYSPDNCRWISHTEQVRNRSNTIRLDIGGQEKTLKEWCEKFGVDYKSAHSQYKKGVPVQLIFNIKIETVLKDGKE